MTESGIFYSSIIDPILKPMRVSVANHIQPGRNVIDIACGTGAQVFEIAKKAKRVVGIDISDSMIRYAKRTSLKMDINNTEFVVCDASNLDSFADNEFDVATMSLALHQFNPNFHSIILSEMKRVARKIIICDYSIPLPKNIAGFSSQVAEFLAGSEHNKNFKLYTNLGGLNSILRANNLKIEQSEYFANGAFHLVICLPH